MLSSMMTSTAVLVSTNGMGIPSAASATSPIHNEECIIFGAARYGRPHFFTIEDNASSVEKITICSEASKNSDAGSVTPNTPSVHPAPSRLTTSTTSALSISVKQNSFFPKSLNEAPKVYNMRSSRRRNRSCTEERTCNRTGGYCML